MARKQKYIRKYPSLPHSYDEGQMVDNIVDNIKSLNLSPDQVRTLYDIVVHSSISMRQGSGLLYSQILDIIEFSIKGTYTSKDPFGE